MGAVKEKFLNGGIMQVTLPLSNNTQFVISVDNNYNYFFCLKRGGRRLDLTTKIQEWLEEVNEQWI